MTVYILEAVTVKALAQIQAVGFVSAYMQTYINPAQAVLKSVCVKFI